MVTKTMVNCLTQHSVVKTKLDQDAIPLVSLEEPDWLKPRDRIGAVIAIALQVSEFLTEYTMYCKLLIWLLLYGVSFLDLFSG